MVREVSRSAAVLVAVAALAVLTSPGPARGQDLGQLDRQYKAELEAGRYRAAERIARRGLEVAAASRDELAVGSWCNGLGLALYDQGRYAEAEPLYKRALAIAEKALGPDHPDVASCLNNLAILYKAQGRYAEAEPLYKRALAIREKALGPDHPSLAQSLNNLALLYDAQGRYVEAEPLYKRALAIWEKALGPDHPDVASCLNNLALLYDAQGRYAEAEPLYNRALAIWEKALGPDHPDVATCLNNLASLYQDQGRYAEAEPLYKRALAIREKSLGPDHPDVAESLNNLAGLYQAQGRYAEAEPPFKRALAINEKSLGPDHPDVATSLNNLASLYQAQGRYAEAEPPYKRALAICEKALGPDHPHVATSLNNLAGLYQAEGRYAEAEPPFKRALAIDEKALGPDHRDVARDLNNLALLYQAEGRYAEAEPLLKRALAICEKALGPDHPDVANSLASLAYLYDAQGRYAEAEPPYKRALAICEKALGPDHPHVASSLNNLAVLYQAQGRYAEAEPLYKRALAIKEKALGPDHPLVANSLNNLAGLYESQGRYAEAESLVDRAVTLFDRAGVGPGERFRGYFARAKLSWRAGRRGEALGDLRQALRLAEDQRGHASGAERERAELFAQYTGAYERMVQWQAELGDVGEALAAIERSRARSLLDEIALAGADLQAGRPTAERIQLERQGAAVREQAARLEKQLEQAERDPARKAEAGRLRDELAGARRRLYEQDRDARATSPVYRELLNHGAGPPPLDQVRRRLCGDGGLLLEYLFGQDGGYVVAVGPDGARLEALRLDADDAKELGVEPGPLTAERLRAVLVGAKGSGVVPRLADPGAGSPAPMLAVLWRVLVPEAQRRALVDGTAKRLVVVPDGPLAFLPFEALVVEGRKDPKYLLDVGPPVTYAQSATVLISLADRRGSRRPGRPRAGAGAGRPGLSRGRAGARGRPRRWGADGPVAVQPGRRQAAAAAVLRVGGAVGRQGVPRRRGQGGRLHRRVGHRSGRALLGARPQGPPPGLSRANRSVTGQLLRGAGAGARPERRRRPGRRRLPDAGGDLRTGPERLRASHPLGVPDELRPAAEGGGDVVAVARLPGGRGAAGGGEQLAGRRRGGGQPGQHLLHPAGQGREAGRAGRVRPVAARGQALGAEAGEVEGPLLLGQPRPRRAALTPGRASTARRRPRSAGREPRP